MIGKPITRAIADFFASSPTPGRMTPQTVPMQIAMATMGNAYPQNGTTGVQNGLPLMWGLMDRLSMPGQREQALAFFDTLSREMSEINVALNAYATMSTTGDVDGRGIGTFKVRPMDTGSDTPQKLKDLLEQLNDRVISQHAFGIGRGMAKYGSFPPALRFDNKGIADIEYIPPGTMRRKIVAAENKKTMISDPARYWQQVRDENTLIDDIPVWKAPHFGIFNDPVSSQHTRLYGSSMLESCGRHAYLMGMLVDSMAVARMARAPMRYEFRVPCGDIAGDTDKIVARLRAFRTEFKRERIRLPDGTTNSIEKPYLPDDDFFTPDLGNSQGGVHTLVGDTNLGNIEDVRFMYSMFLGAIGVPPEYLGQERSQGGRSVLSQIDIQFARSSRALQLYLAGGFVTMGHIHMLANGFDPVQYPIECAPPNIGSRDDLVRAQVSKVHSEVLKNLVESGLDVKVNPRWVLQTFLGLDQELYYINDKDLSALFAGSIKADKTSAATEEALRKIVTTNDPALEKLRDIGRRIVMVSIPDSAHYRTNQPPARALLACKAAIEQHVRRVAA